MVLGFRGLFRPRFVGRLQLTPAACCPPLKFCQELLVPSHLPARRAPTLNAALNCVERRDCLISVSVRLSLFETLSRVACTESLASTAAGP